MDCVGEKRRLRVKCSTLCACLCLSNLLKAGASAGEKSRGYFRTSLSRARPFQSTQWTQIFIFL